MRLFYFQRLERCEPVDVNQAELTSREATLAKYKLQCARDAEKRKAELAAEAQSAGALAVSLSDELQEVCVPTAADLFEGAKL